MKINDICKKFSIELIWHGLLCFFVFEYQRCINVLMNEKIDTLCKLDNSSIISQKDRLEVAR